MTIFYLVRHGETAWNIQGRWQGHTDIALNAAGYAQAQLLAQRLHNEGTHFDVIYSSDLLRAWETASAVGTALQLVPKRLPALREIDVGGWSGLVHAEVVARDADLYARMESGEDVRRGRTGERFADLYNRMVAVVEQLHEEWPDGRVMLVSHGGSIRALLLHAARDKDDPLPRPLHVGNTSISVIRCEQGEWSIDVVNDMAHLGDAVQLGHGRTAPPDDAERA